MSKNCLCDMSYIPLHEIPFRHLCKASSRSANPTFFRCLKDILSRCLECLHKTSLKHQDVFLPCGMRILVKSNKTVSSGEQSLTELGWNQLPKNIKYKICFSKFKEYIDTWFGPKCKCNISVLTLSMKIMVKMILLLY